MKINRSDEINVLIKMLVATLAMLAGSIALTVLAGCDDGEKLQPKTPHEVCLGGCEAGYGVCLYSLSFVTDVNRHNARVICDASLRICEWDCLESLDAGAEVLDGCDAFGLHGHTAERKVRACREYISEHLPQ